MKRIFSTALLLGAVATSFAQITFSGRANVLFPTQSAKWEQLKDTVGKAYSDKGNNSTGFNVGLSAKIDLPITSLFVMPELYYTHFSNKTIDAATNTTLEAKSNRIDVPVLLGYNIWGKTLGAFIGPVASYNITDNSTFQNFKENVKNNFTMGYQLGAQAQFQKLIVNARYEGSFSKDQRDFVNAIVGVDRTVRYDNRPSMFILGLGYAF